MVTISSHVLDAVIGTHAAGIRVQCFRRDALGTASLIFDQAADKQGRITQSVEIAQDEHGWQYLSPHSYSVWWSGDPPDAKLI